MNSIDTAAGTAVGSPVGETVAESIQRSWEAKNTLPTGHVIGVDLGDPVGDYSVVTNPDHVPDLNPLGFPGDPSRGRKRWTADEDTAVLLIGDDARAASELGRTVAAIKSRRSVLVRFGSVGSDETPIEPPDDAVDDLGGKDEQSANDHVVLDESDAACMFVEPTSWKATPGPVIYRQTIGQVPKAIRVFYYDADSDTLLAVGNADNIAIGDEVVMSGPIDSDTPTGPCRRVVVSLDGNKPHKVLNAYVMVVPKPEW